jgi:hypothetical protein
MATMTGDVGSSSRARRTGRNEMNRFYAKSAIVAVVALGGWTLVAPVNAAPPTVTPSPGYDARLQEQRAASTVAQPVAPTPTPIVPHRVKRHHVSAH